MREIIFTLILIAALILYGLAWYKIGFNVGVERSFREVRQVLEKHGFIKKEDE